MAVTGNNGYYVQHTAAADATTGRLKIKEVVWFGFSNANHTLQVKDGAGNIVIPEVAAGAAATVIGIIHIPIGRVLNGVETDVLGSGTALYLLD